MPSDCPDILTPGSGKVVNRTRFISKFYRDSACFLSPGELFLIITFDFHVHINLAPDTRKETKRLFDAFSAGGKISTPLQDKFRGAYYGSCTDKYGMQWMLNCHEK